MKCLGSVLLQPKHLNVVYLNVVAAKSNGLTTFATTHVKQAVWEAATICPRPCKLTFDLLTLKVVFESFVSWATSVPILIFLGLSVLDLRPMYATDRRQTRIIA